ncbi:MAG TPA: hypothetical protein ACQGQH_03530 [Xylella sp.]
MNIHTEPSRWVDPGSCFLFSLGIVLAQGAAMAEVIEFHAQISCASDVEGEATRLTGVMDVSPQVLRAFRVCRLDGVWSDVSLKGSI